MDFHYTGFEWIDFRDVENSIIAFLRRGARSEGFSAVLLQLHAGAAQQLRVRRAGGGLLPGDPELRIRRCSAAATWATAAASCRTAACRGINRPHSISITLPPLAVVAFQERSERLRIGRVRRDHRRRRPQRPGHRRLPGARGPQGAGARTARTAGRLRGHRRDLAGLSRLDRRLSRQPAAGAHRPRSGTGALRLSASTPRIRRSSPPFPTAAISSCGRTRARRWPRSPSSPRAMPRSIPKYEAHLERLARGGGSRCC